MRTVLAFCVIITLVSASMADLYTERSFAITGTNFVFQFEDSALSISNRQRIADDILMIRSFGVSSEIENDPIDGFDGYIYDDNLENPPYFDSELKFPRFFNVVNSTNALFIQKSLSDAYTNAFVFLDSDTNMFLSAHLFIEAFESNRLDSIPSNQIYRLVYYPNASPQRYENKRDRIVSELKCQTYGHPSALSFHQTGPGTNGFPHAATWMRVPCKNWSRFGHKYQISIFHAFWYDGMWRLYPTEW